MSRKPADPRELPVYTVHDAAHYLRISPSTLTTWVSGRTYRTSAGEKLAKPLIATPGSGHPKLLSFFNVVEGHILSAIRRVHKVPMHKVRRAIDRMEREMHSRHPLIDARFQTDGIDLFVEQYERLVDQDGQLAIRSAIETSLKRIEWDDGRRGLASRLYPFVYSNQQPDEPKVVVIDPRRAFGRPVLVGTGIQTATIASRHRAGDSIESLARDYNLPTSKVEDAIRCELRAA
jgi:uncharacterized protein (DUF433 family)